jgi:hypothetical protein
MHRTLLPAAAATALALALTGCSGSSDQAAPKAGGASSASPSTSTGSSSSTGSEQNGMAEAGVGLEALDHLIATVTAKTGMEDDPTGSVKVALLELKRKDKLLVLTAAVTPTTTLAKPRSLFRSLGSHTWRPTLVDSINLKQYSVVRASNNLLATGDLSVSAGSGQPMFVYAVFAAPPPDVTKINVLFADSIPAFKDVPVQ